MHFILCPLHFSPRATACSLCKCKRRDWLGRVCNRDLVTVPVLSQMTQCSLICTPAMDSVGRLTAQVSSCAPHQPTADPAGINKCTDTPDQISTCSNHLSLPSTGWRSDVSGLAQRRPWLDHRPSSWWRISTTHFKYHQWPQIRAHHQTFLSVQDNDLKAYTANNPDTQIIRPDWELNLCKTIEYLLNRLGSRQLAILNV